MITYNLKAVKPKLIDWVKSNVSDFCSDMFKEIQNAARHKSPDDIEMFLAQIRETEKLSVDYTKIINEAQTLADILKIADEDIMFNIFYEREDEIITIILGVKIEQVYL